MLNTLQFWFCSLTPVRRSSAEDGSCAQKIHQKKPECLPAARRLPKYQPARCVERMDASTAAHVRTSSGHQRGSQHDLRCHGHGRSDRRQRHHNNRHSQPLSTVSARRPLCSLSDSPSARDHWTEPGSYEKVGAVSRLSLQNVQVCRCVSAQASRSQIAPLHVSQRVLHKGEHSN